MKKALLAIALFFSIGRAFCADYGIDRREVGEPFLGNRIAGTIADLTKDTGLPPLLSQTGAFEPFKPTGPLVPTRAMIPYTVNTPLWSDGALKLRWIYIPKDAQIELKQNGTAWLFPPGTVIVKHFDLITDYTASPKAQKRVETRFIAVGNNGKIFYFSYQWKDDQTDATLVPAAGTTKDFTIAGGTPNPQTWGFPSRTDDRAGCVRCHNTAVGLDPGGVAANNGTLGIIGVKTAQLNGSLIYQPKGVEDNQLRTLRKIGLFKNAPAAWDNAVDLNGTKTIAPPVPQMAQFGKDSLGNSVNNTAFNIETRVRSYLDSNCAHCHGGKDHEQSGWDGRFTTLFKDQSIADDRIKFAKALPPIAGGNRDRGIYGRDALNMPATSLVRIRDAQWIALLQDYITMSFNLTGVTPDPSVRNKITLVFDNPLDATSAKAPGNYVLSLASNPATTINLNGNGTVSGKTVTFNLAANMDRKKEYKLTVTGDVFDNSTPQNKAWVNKFVQFRAPDVGPAPPGDDGLPPANDNFSSATPLTGVDAVDTGFNCYATKETSEPDHAGNASSNSVWWVWTAPTNSLVSIDTFGSDFDTVLAVYTGSSVSALSPVESSDDADEQFRPPGTDHNASLVRFTPVQGQTYYIAVGGHDDGYFSQCGTIQLHLHAAPPPQGPPNDSFSAPFALSGLSGSIVSSNTFATKEDGEPDHAGQMGGASVWWRWTAPSDGQVTFDTHGSSFDTLLAVYLGTSVSNLIVVAENDDDSELFTSGVQFSAAAGTTYSIAVDGFDFQTGAITLNYTLTAAPVALLPSIQTVPSFMVVPTEDGALHLRIDGPAGAEVDVQVSDDLVQWTSVATKTLSGAAWDFSDPISAQNGHRFYRVVRHLD